VPVVIDEVEAEVETPPAAAKPAASSNESQQGQSDQLHPKLDRFLRIRAERAARIRAY
jgi:hypothetical protein